MPLSALLPSAHKITFDTNGGSEIAPITQDYGTAITAPVNPTREGYAFMGWDKEIPATMPEENVVIKARWKDTEKPTVRLTQIITLTLST